MQGIRRVHSAVPAHLGFTETSQNFTKKKKKGGNLQIQTSKYLVAEQELDHRLDGFDPKVGSLSKQHGRVQVKESVSKTQVWPANDTRCCCCITLLVKYNEFRISWVLRRFVRKARQRR